MEDHGWGSGRVWLTGDCGVLLLPGGMLSAVGGCELATTKRVKTSWKKLKEMLPDLHPAISRTRPAVACTALAFGTRCSIEGRGLQRLRRNGRAMIGQICNVKPEDVTAIRSNVLLAQLGIDGLDVVLVGGKGGGGFACSDISNGAIKRVCDIQIYRKRGPGRSKMSWKTLTERE